MRIGLLAEGGPPYADGATGLWCDRLVRGLEQHEFTVYALDRDARREVARPCPLPAQVRAVHTAPLWTPAEENAGYRRRGRRRFTDAYTELAEALCAPRPGPGPIEPTRSSPQADRFSNALYALAELARELGPPGALFRSEPAVRALERAGRSPGAPLPVRAARVTDLLTVADRLERALRPLALDWYDEGLGRVDVAHATTGGPAALAGLIARHFFGTPLLLTEYGAQLRAHHLEFGPDHRPEGQRPEPAPQARHETPGAAPVRALLGAFHGLLAAETYRRADVITSGNAQTRRWQEHCGADRATLRTVHPGQDAAPFAEVGESGDGGEPGTLVWVGRIEPAKDLVCLLHAFAEIRRAESTARLRIIALPDPRDSGGDPEPGAQSGCGTGTAGGPAEADGYPAQCRALAAQLFPDEADGRHSIGANPVSFEELGGPEAPDLAEVYAGAGVVVLSSVIEGFPTGLVDAMFCGRATVSTDAGAVVEVIGGTGLVVPPRNPKALAEACLSLLRDPGRRGLLGAAARARALELFTVEQNVMAFHGIYLDLVSHSPARPIEPAQPFALPAEARLPVPWRPEPALPSWTAQPAPEPAEAIR
ncbi:DUF3492 domain-containing protein [Streptomyces sp. NPDC058045]|uniref:DUF3492 domain-containing protein n=1 Tax=Streptomyces sp. NPDC058045 TaxID=3346311 RepID=UPI0036E2EAEE